METPYSALSVLSELESQSEQVRQIFIYTICQAMVEAGHLEFKGSSVIDGVGTALIFRNVDSDAVFEIIKPDISTDDEEAIREHIRQLLEKQD